MDRNQEQLPRERVPQSDQDREDGLDQEQARERGDGMPPRIEGGVQREYTNEAGVTSQIPLQRPQVGPEGVDLIYRGVRGSNANVHRSRIASSATQDVVVPPVNPDTGNPETTFFLEGNEKLPFHDEGETYHFDMGRPTRVKPEHAEWLLSDKNTQLRFEKLESVREREEKIRQEAKQEAQQEAGRQKQKLSDEEIDRLAEAVVRRQEASRNRGAGGSETPVPSTESGFGGRSRSREEADADLDAEKEREARGEQPPKNPQLSRDVAAISPRPAAPKPLETPRKP